jgi:Outer membrane protein transport protein (OMPP1/FadL/TodX)
MKKRFSILIAGLTVFSIQSQNINDALRYAQEDLTGTARFRAMSGAFGALGGDFSSLNVNPAGSVVFANNQVGFSLSNYNTDNKSNYFGTNTSEKDSAFDVNQAGGVFVFNNPNQKTNWKKFALAINYDNVKNLDNSFYSAGTNPTNSIANYFLSYANGNGGIPLELLQTLPGESLQQLYSYLGGLPDNSYPTVNGYDAQQALLGFRAFIIDPNSPSTTQYISLVAPGGNYYQQNEVVTSGYNGKLTLNASAQYTDKLSFGLNVNSYFTDYRQASIFTESNSNNTSTTDLVKRVRFGNELYTYGTGLSFQLGTIFKPIKEIRIGLAYESPTWYRLNDEFTQYVIATSGSTNGDLAPDFADPETTMVYEPYRLQTPGKFTGSFAYVFGKTGLISFDYAIKDYSKTQFRPSRDFTGANSQMENVLDVASEFRIGAEYKIKKLSLRGGYRMEESPYKNGKTVGDLTGYSGGLGYNFGRFKLDMAYSYAERDSQQTFFSQGLIDTATITSKNNNVTLSLTFEL